MTDITQLTPSGGVYRIKRAKGSMWGNHRKIAIAFNADDFEAIAMKAVMEGRSFAAQVRHYIELGRRVDTR